MPEIFIYLQKYVNLGRKTQHAVITHANTSINGIKIPTFFGKSWGMMLNLSNAPLRALYHLDEHGFWFVSLPKYQGKISNLFLHR